MPALQLVGCRTIKNVSGRVLVGLRWWNYVDEAGENQWVFESLPVPACQYSTPCTHTVDFVQESEVHRIDARNSRLFWGALYVTPIIWILLLIGAILQASHFWHTALHR